MRARNLASAVAIALGLAGVTGCSSSNGSSNDGGAGDAPTVDTGTDGSIPPTDSSTATDVATSNDSGSVTATDSGAGGDAGSCHGDTSPLPCMPDSVFYEALPASPQIASNSSATMAYYSANWALDYAGTPFWNKGVYFAADPQGGDGNLASVYFAKTTDPVYTVQCFEPWCANGSAPIDGKPINIPTGAEWQGYPDCADAGAGMMTRGNCGDDHMVVISPDRQTEYDLYESWGCFQNGSSCIIGSGAIVPVASTLGFATAAQGNTNATGWVLTQGLVQPSEILAGVIPHALALIMPCSDGTSVGPSTGDGIYACPDTTNALSIGQRIFLAATDAQIASWGSSGVTVPGQMILTALAHFGGYYVDNLGYGGMDVETLNEASFQPPGTLTNGWPAIAAKYSLPAPNGNGYDLGLNNVPGGISTWLKACAKTGC
jgi:hypothetical protein